MTVDEDYIHVSTIMTAKKQTPVKTLENTQHQHPNNERTALGYQGEATFVSRIKFLYPGLSNSF